MNLRASAFLVLALYVTGCCDHEIRVPSCDVGEPTTQLPWLKEKIEDIEVSSIRQYTYVMQAEYQGKTVFYISNCCPFCLSAPPAVYDCEGNELFQLTGAGQVSNERLVWKPSDFQCTI